MDEKKTYFIERLATVKTKTELEYAIDIKVVLELYGISREDIKGGIICSVVPQITASSVWLRRKCCAARSWWWVPASKRV